MPSLTLHVDKTLANERLSPEAIRGLGYDLETAVLSHLKPAPETFQFNLIVCEACGPTYPVSAPISPRQPMHSLRRQGNCLHLFVPRHDPSGLSAVSDLANCLSKTAACLSTNVVAHTKLAFFNNIQNGL